MTKEIRAKKHIRILGTRGIPAQHGGFETFAEALALYLVGRQWEVTVYCQEEGEGKAYRKKWNGIELVHIPVKKTGALGTMVFDWLSILDAARSKSPVLTLGYNTALFCVLYRIKGITNLINMDGIEWRREKWSLPEKTWLFFNERLGALLGNHLVADNPGIKERLSGFVAGSKISMIPYGSEFIVEADPKRLNPYDLEPGQYALVVARAEPENSILEIVKAFSSMERGIKLVVLGKYEPEIQPYHQAVMNAAGNEVMFPGAIYERETVAALRCHCRLYLHGHRVGGTNPSLVEALGAGCPVLAHDNSFNRWVAGDGAYYFRDEEECREQLAKLVDDKILLSSLSQKGRQRHREEFTWNDILGKYETLLEGFF